MGGWSLARNISVLMIISDWEMRRLAYPPRTGIHSNHRVRIRAMLPHDDQILENVVVFQNCA